MNRVVFSLLLLLMACRDSTRGKAQGKDAGRQQVHWSPEKGRMGVPAGFVYGDGQYHLFYQQKGGGAQLTHAASRNLLNWTNLPDAVLPDNSGSLLAGSIIFDSSNSSGLGSDGKPPFIAFYIVPVSKEKTGNPESSALVYTAYSPDEGQTWQKTKTSPLVISGELHSGPKVFWHDASGHWVLYLIQDGQLAFYVSTDALHWKSEGRFSGSQQPGNAVWQFPDFFPLAVKGTNETKWVLMVSETILKADQAPVTKYFIGDFDGHRFEQNQVVERNFSFLLDYGLDVRAGMTCSNAPGKRITLTGLMDAERYKPADTADAFSSSAIFPRQLNLVKDGFLYLLTAPPVPGIEQLHGKTDSLGSFDVPITSKVIFNQWHPGEQAMEIRIRFDISNQDWIGFPLSYGIKFQNSAGDHYTVRYKNDFKSFSISRYRPGEAVWLKQYNQDYDLTYKTKGPVFDWRILLDRSSVELFADSNKISISNLLHPSAPLESVELFSERSPVHVLSCTVTELKPI